VNSQVTCHCSCFVLLANCNQPTSEEDDISRQSITFKNLCCFYAFDHLTTLNILSSGALKLVCHIGLHELSCSTKY
jgi:hypothetical protein